MRFEISDLSHERTTIFKGIAILLIVTHAFFHLVDETPKENEFSFQRANFDAFVATLVSAPEESVRNFSSYLGHFGVQMFIFLSAFGLTRKYASQRLQWFPFVKSRCKKLYPPFLLALALWAFVACSVLGPISAPYDHWKSILLKVCLVSNFVPGEVFRPVGPWWFLSFIFQFYVIFPLLVDLQKRYAGKGLFCLAAGGVLASMTLNAFLLENFDIYLSATILGHLPEIALGMHLARQTKPVRMGGSWLLASIAVFILGNLYEPWWHLNHISALIILLWCLIRVGPCISASSRCRNILLFYGRISMCLFLVNGFCRDPFLHMARSIDKWYMTILAGSLSLVTATTLAVILMRMEQRLRSRISGYASRQGPTGRHRGAQAR